MKKKRYIGLIILSALMAFVCACNGKNKDNSEEDPNSGWFFNDNTGYTDVDYYGCPTSKRIKKLNLKKNRV